MVVCSDTKARTASAAVCAAKSAALQIPNCRISVGEVEEARSAGSSSPTSPFSDNTDSSSETSAMDSVMDFEDEIMGENRCLQELETRKAMLSDCSVEHYDVCEVDAVAEALMMDGSDLSAELKKYVRQLKCEINSSQVGWLRLNKETDVVVLSTLLYDWLECLRLPVVRSQYLENIVVLYKQPEECFQKFEPVK